MSDDFKLSAQIPLRVSEVMAANLQVEATMAELKVPALVRMYCAEGLARSAAARQGAVTSAEVNAIAAAKRHGLDPVAELAKAVEAKLEQDANGAVSETRNPNP